MNKEIAERIEMINQGRIPEGYKENNNLKIPNEWNVLDLGNIMDLKKRLKPLALKILFQNLMLEIEIIKK